MVLGIVALSIAWIPFLFVLGVIAAILALIFATVAWRRAGSTGVGRSFAVVGFATAGSALVAAVLGGILSVVVLDVYDEYLNPQPSDVAVTSCRLEGSRATMTGRLTNTGEATSSYSVRIGFVRPGTDNPHRSEVVALDDVAPGDSTTFEAQSQVDLDEVDCLILEVTGPLPFGLEVD
jgi:membrane protein implicated in regulation of membrane protease activity